MRDPLEWLVLIEDLFFSAVPLGSTGPSAPPPCGPLKGHPIGTTSYVNIVPARIFTGTRTFRRLPPIQRGSGYTGQSCEPLTHFCRSGALMGVFRGSPHTTMSLQPRRLFGFGAFVLAPLKARRLPRALCAGRPLVLTQKAGPSRRRSVDDSDQPGCLTSLERVLQQGQGFDRRQRSRAGGASLLDPRRFSARRMPPS